MLEPGQDWLCGGCASFTDNIADQSHLNARDTALILTPYGRQEAWEDSPPGWPQDTTMSWIQIRDEY
jgi:predicted dithiol-disulfide oxidoreductase (DUF899 family)